MPKAEALPHNKALETDNRSRVGGVWIYLAISVIFVILMLVFILQNNEPVPISYIGFNGSVPFGIAMLLAAVAGATIALIIGSARIIQLKRSNKDNHQSTSE